jgi:hypothetical protein
MGLTGRLERVVPSGCHPVVFENTGSSDEAATRIRTWSVPGRGTGTRTASRGNPARALVWPTPRNVFGIVRVCLLATFLLPSLRQFATRFSGTRESPLTRTGRDAIAPIAEAAQEVASTNKSG